MKLSSLFFLTLCISFFSEANSVPQGNQTFIKTSQLSSWNQIKWKQGVYADLSQPSHNYQLNKRLSSTSGKSSYQIILVKKLLNWEQQHSNGFEVSLANLNLHVEQLTQLNFKIKLSPEKSIITSNFETLADKNSWLNSNRNYIEKNSNNDIKNFSKLLSEQANFTLMFYGKNNGKPTQQKLYAAYSFKLQIDSKQQWHTFNITKNDLNYYWQKNYQKESIFAKEVATEKWQGFILVAESGNSKVVRNYMPSSFPKEYTEVFNEFDITLTDLSIITELK